MQQQKNVFSSCLVIPRSVTVDVLAGSIPLQQPHLLMILLIEGDLSESYVGLVACERSLGSDELSFHTRTDPKLQNGSLNF